jgi:predicted RecB family nuclease
MSSPSSAITRIGAPAVVLDETAATACPVKTRHAYARPGQELGEGPDIPDPVHEERERERGAFVADVLSWWMDVATRSVDLRGTTNRAERVGVTLGLMRNGSPLIVGPALPNDVDGHRAGAPDALLRCDDRTGSPRYHPVIVKWHKVMVRPRSEAGQANPEDDVAAGADRPLLARLVRPRPREAEPTESRLRLQSRLADFLQLAHHHRLLEAAGFAGEPWGGVIGTDQLPDEPLLSWVRLDRPMVRVVDHDAAAGWGLRSLLDQADTELTHRVAIADAVRAAQAHPAEIISPVLVNECRTCPWWRACRTELDPDDLSLRIARGRLDRTEVSALRTREVGTVAALATADLDSLLPAYLPDVAHRPDAEPRIRAVARRARMLHRGEPIERETSGPIDVPSSEVEIDLDIETSAAGRIYLWGFAVSTRAESGARPRYVEFSRFTELDEAGELALAREAMSWLRGQVEGGHHGLVFHYSGFEVAMIEALAARASDDQVLAWAATYARSTFVDLLEIVQAHFFGATGLGLKQIAVTAGFGWRDPDPGGLNSQRWFDEAVHASDADTRAAARRRVLAYNEDDVRATAHLREWLRAQ